MPTNGHSTGSFTEIEFWALTHIKPQSNSNDDEYKPLSEFVTGGQVTLHLIGRVARHQNALPMTGCLSTMSKMFNKVSQLYWPMRTACFGQMEPMSLAMADAYNQP